MEFTYEQKVQAVNLVVNDHLSYLKAGRTIGASKTTVMQWVKRAEEHGIEALKKDKQRKHTGEFKIEVVEYMHGHCLSAYTAAAHFNVAKAQVERWERIYYEEGAEALLAERRGRTSNKMPRKKKSSQEIAAQEDVIAELQRLRMENEYLKKLSALAQRRQGK